MSPQADSKSWMKWLIFAAVVYFILPWDLIPDLLGLVGRIDDLLVIAWLGWTYRGALKQAFAGGAAQATSGEAFGSRGDSHQNGSAGRPPSNAVDAFDPYEVLGVALNASPEMVQSAYRARMMEYHPDKVAHLGVELQELALEKSQAIERAYRYLRK